VTIEAFGSWTGVILSLEPNSAVVLQVPNGANSDLVYIRLDTIKNVSAHDQEIHNTLDLDEFTVGAAERRINESMQNHAKQISRIGVNVPKAAQVL
jgi:hypothetical protein